MSEWIQQAARLADERRDFVIVTVVARRGSAPRDAGERMLVTREDIVGSIGGGNLEYRAIEEARRLLNEGGKSKVLALSLGAALGQCCGGRVALHLEALFADAPQIFLYGAGHVGGALARIIAPLPYRLTWVDSRPGQFPSAAEFPGAEFIHSENPSDEAADAPAGAYHLVMTHSHQLDLEICEAILRRGDFGFLGVIGSASKAKRFFSLLHRRGLPAERMRCPIGGFSGNHPAEIAAAVAGELVGEVARAIAKRDGDTSAKEMRDLLEIAEVAAKD